MISLTDNVILDPMQYYLDPVHASCVQKELLTRVIGVATSVFALIDLVANVVAAVCSTVYILAKSIVCCYNPADYQFLSDSILNIFKFTMLTAFGSVFGIFIPNCLVSTCFKNDSDTTAPTPPVPLVVPPSPRAGSVTPPPSPVSSDSGIRSSSPVVVPLITQPVRTGPGAPTTRIPPVTTILPGTGRSPGSTPSPGIITSPVDLTNPLVRAQHEGKHKLAKGAGSLAVDEELDVAAEESAAEFLFVLAEDVRTGVETAPFGQLKAFYASASFYTKLRFYETFSEDIPEYAAVRKEFTPIIFQSKHSTQTPFTWLSDRELLDAADALPTTAPLKATLSAKGIDWHDNFHRSMYFHATKSIDLVSTILTGRKLEVRHGYYYGVYISTKPEYRYYGRFVFAFKEKIAHTSPQVNATKTDDNSYWSGLAQDVDLNPDFIAYIMVAPDVSPTDNTDIYSDTYGKKDDIEAQVKLLRAEIKRLYDAKIIDSEIPVVSYLDMLPHIQQLKTLSRGLPKTWQRPGGYLITNRTAADVPALYGRKTT